MADGIRNERVDAEGGEYQREGCESAKQHNDETARRSRFVDELLQSPEADCGQIGIKRLQSVTNARRKLVGRQRSSDHEVNGRVVLGLPDGQIKFRARALLEGKMPHVPYDAYHSAVDIHLHDLAKRVLAWPQHSCQSSIDYDHRQRTRGVTLAEVPSHAKRDAHGVEITVAHDTDESVGIFASLVHLAFCGDAPATIAPERQGVRQSRRFDSGNVQNAVQGFCKVSIALSLGRVRCVGIDAQRGGPFRTKPQINIEDTKEATDEQAGRGQKHAGKSDLRHNQRAANPSVHLRLTGTSIGIFQRVVKRDARNLQSGYQSEQQAGQQCHHYCEGEGAGVDADVFK